MSARTARCTAWALCVLTLLAALVQVVLRVPHLDELAERYDPFLVFPIITVATLAAAAVGAVIVSRHPRHPVGWLFCVGNAVAELGLAAAAYHQHSGLQDDALPGAPWAAWVQSMAGSNFALGVLVLTLLLFPTGRLPSRRWRPVAWVAVLNLLALEGLIALRLGSPADAVPLADRTLDGTARALAMGLQYVLVGCLLAGAASLVVRRRRASGVERQQLRVFSLAGAFLAAAIVLVALAGPLAELGLSRAVPGTLFYLAYGSLPVAAGLAMLRYRLYDVDLVLNRAALLTALLTLITVGYVAVVVAAGALLGEQVGSGTAVSIAATTLVAVAVQPARRRLRRLADRLVYGPRATPYEVLATFADRLGEAMALDDVLPRTAQAAARGLGADSASVRVHLADGRSTGATWPPGASPVADGLVVPVLHAGERVGEVRLDLPAGAVPSERGTDLLSGLAAQAGLALRNVRLTAELRDTLDQLSAHQAALSASRARLLGASTTERQRLERRIRVAVVPHLTAIEAQLPSVRACLDDGPRAAALLEELAERALAGLEALRDIARGVFPPVLADRGLVPALQSAAAASATPVVVTAGPVPRLPGEVESAAYFCCLELFSAAALAGAPVACGVAVVDGELRVGLDTEADLDVALRSVEDRVAAVGGSLRRRPAPGAPAAPGVDLALPTTASPRQPAAGVLVEAAG